ncbi:arylesterase [Spizellomyces sp. 'palustris']|nr:arylesterase [Spizellomyces sp. 'palustris']
MGIVPKGGIQKSGELYAYDVNKPSHKPQRLSTPDFAREFHPLGLSLYTTPDKTTFLYAINLAYNGFSIEIFSVHLHNATLKHERTISHPLITTPNSITVVNDSTFYVTNDHGFPSGFLHALETYLGLPLSNVVQYSDGQARVVATRLVHANGITLDHEKKRMYVSESLAGRISVYRVDRSGSLEYDTSVDVGFVTDNLDLDPATGDVTVAGHPKPLALVMFAKWGAGPSGSIVKRIKERSTNDENVAQDDQNNWDVQTVFEDDGNFHPASSTGALVKRKDGTARMIITSLYGEDALTDCSTDTWIKGLLRKKQQQRQ